MWTEKLGTHFIRKGKHEKHMVGKWMARGVKDISVKLRTSVQGPIDHSGGCDTHQ